MKFHAYFLTLAVVICGCSYSSNGERIFFTATSEHGPIVIKEGPPMFKGAVKGCAHCHGRDGKGGHALDASGMKGTDIRYKTLVMRYSGYLAFLEDKGEEVHGGIDTLIKRAIRDGEGPGYELNVSMPRWAMSDNDVDDIVNYLKTLN